jgi:two-component system response regulator HydG
MNDLMKQARQVAPLDITLLLTGETGTGKTRLARLIHELSPRCDEPFVVIDGGALAPALIDSEMFGHIKGAFTGADHARPGKFAAAGGGTLLLDDVDALPPTVQAKLLRVVEDRVFEPVGSNRSQPVEARLIVASNRALQQEVSAGRFRADLYYRLNVVSFHLPPLREQPNRVPELVTHFLKDYAARSGRPVEGMDVEAISVLQAYSWPGNIRELRNVIERAVILCPNRHIGVGDLPPSLHSTLSPALSIACPPVYVVDGPLSRLGFRSTKEKIEAALIREALQKHGNNRSRAARELGICRQTLSRKLRQYGLT